MKNTIKLVNVQPRRNVSKFWNVQVIGRVAVCSWGRIGSWEQEKEFNFRSVNSAIEFAVRKAASKIAKGYEFASGPVSAMAEVALDIRREMA